MKNHSLVFLKASGTSEVLITGICRPGWGEWTRPAPKQEAPQLDLAGVRGWVCGEQGSLSSWALPLWSRSSDSPSEEEWLSGVSKLRSRLPQFHILQAAQTV